MRSPRFTTGAQSAPRRTTRDSAQILRAALEPLEQRYLLATHVINGTPADDTWVINAAPGQVVNNGVTTNDASITDVQVNAFGGSDTLILNSASIPVVFNGGDDGDLLNISGGQLASLTAAVTFNGNAGGDTLRIDALPSVGISGSANLTFHGGAGEFDFLQIFNYSATDAWTYTRTSDFTLAQRAGYSLQVISGDIEYTFVAAGSAADHNS